MDSSMINTMYDDDSSSRGPLAAIGSSEGRAPTKQDIQSRIPLPFDVETAPRGSQRRV